MTRIIKNKKLKTKKLKSCWRTLSRFSRASKKKLYGGSDTGATYNGGTHDLSAIFTYTNNSNKQPIKDKYNCNMLLGKGAYGIVVGCNRDDETIAVKYLDISKINPDNNKAKRERVIAIFNREKNIHSQLDHENIVKFLSDITRADFELDPALNITSSEFFALEHCERGNLAAYLISMNDKPVKREPIIAQIFAGLKYLYYDSIIHLDIKPQNILVTGKIEPIFKIADFGLAKELTGEYHVQIPTSQLRCGTMEYIPYFAQPTTFFRDLYAFYCVIYYITTCKHLNAGKYKHDGVMDVERIDAKKYAGGPFSWLDPICAILSKLQNNNLIIPAPKQAPAVYSNAGIGNIEGIEQLNARPKAKAITKQTSVPVNYKFYEPVYKSLDEVISKLLTPAGKNNIPATPVKLTVRPKPITPKNTVFTYAVKTLAASADPDLAINPPLTPVKQNDELI